MKHFFKALVLFIKMYREGFYFSDNSYKDPDGSKWGFYRFNGPQTRCLFDVDFRFYPDNSGFFHSHGDDVRADASLNGLGITRTTRDPFGKKLRHDEFHAGISFRRGKSEKSKHR